MPKPRKVELPKDEVPKWMPSFSDMMTNLLCFFVLMVALSTQREAGFVDTGIGSYMQKLEALGLPGIAPSTRTLIPADSPLAKYRAPRIDPLEKENWVEHTEAMLEEEFDRLTQVDVELQDARERRIPLGLRFSVRNDRLTQADRRNLSRLANTLRRLPGSIEIHGTVTPDENLRWPEDRNLSLKRAVAVHRYLMQNGVAPDRLVPMGTPYPNGAAEDESTRKVELVWRQER